jgi:ABC-type glycerol-3-phosphate transport system permease component
MKCVVKSFSVTIWVLISFLDEIPNEKITKAKIDKWIASNEKASWLAQWLMPVISATWEMEI